MCTITHDLPTAPELQSYDRIVVAFSGGKDSLACLLHLLELGVPAERIELWHHDVDGREGSHLMDWPCTRAYCQAVAAAFGVPIYFSWKAGGFEREMLRNGALTAPTFYETPTGLMQTGGTRGKLGTRMMFPQMSSDLSVRWCSAYLKIDVCATALRNQDRFLGTRTLVVTGERAEEDTSKKGTGRAGYARFEPDRADLRDGERKRRHVDHWRPVHAWHEAAVWAIIERHGVTPHPAYRLGWGRVSCAACIFGSPNQWASLRAVNPAQHAAVAAHEGALGKTIHRKLTVVQSADKGRPYAAINAADAAAALAETFDEPVITSTWTLPAGAFGESCGPS